MRLSAGVPSRFAESRYPATRGAGGAGSKGPGLHVEEGLYAYMPRIFVTVPTRAIATMYAAVRMSTLYLIDVCSTS